MAAALLLLAILATAAADPLLAVDNKGPLGFDLNELLASLLAHYDPYAVDVLAFDVNLPELSAKGGVRNATVTGASGLRLLSLKLDELGDGKAALSLHLPSIQAVGDYEVTGAVKKPITVPLDSAGKFTFGFSDLSVNASVHLGISNEGQILLKDFQLPYWNLTDIEVNLGGLFNGQSLGHMINDILHDTLTHVITKAYHDQFTTLVTTNVVTQGGKYLASLHRDHARPELQSGGLHRVVPAAGVVKVPAVRDDSRTGPRPASLPSHNAQPARRTDLLSLVGLDSEELRGLLTFDLAAPQFYPRGALEPRPDEDAGVQRLLEDGASALPTSDIREAGVDKPFGGLLAARHGEAASSTADKPGVQALGLQGLLAGHGVHLRPVGKPTFYKKGHLSRVQDDAEA